MRPLVQLDHGVHEFHDQYRLADAGPSEQSGLAAAHEGAKQVHHLDAGFEHGFAASGFIKGHPTAMDGAKVVGDQGRFAIQRLSENVRITSYNVCYTKLLRPFVEVAAKSAFRTKQQPDLGAGLGELCFV